MRLVEELSARQQQYLPVAIALLLCDLFEHQLWWQYGLVDPLVRSSGGEATARAIPDARLLMFPEMG